MDIPPDIEELTDAIRVEPELNIFDGQLWFLKHCNRVVDQRFLALWLVSRAYNLQSQKKPGTKGAIDDLERFLAASEIPIQYIAPVAGVHLDHAFYLADGLSLVPRSQVSIPRFRRESLDRTGMAPPEAFLVKRDTLRREDSTPKDSPFRHHLYDHSKELSDVCRMLTIAKDSSPRLVAIWEQTEDWVPCGNHLEFESISWPTERSTAEVVQFSETTLKIAGYFYHRYRRLPDEVKNTLALYLDRLNSASGQHNVVDSAIDLGIAFEIFFRPRKAKR
ncbi:MAG: hypothetical protein ABSG46_14090 [Candidatus Binataceae bacterium]